MGALWFSFCVSSFLSISLHCLLFLSSAAFASSRFPIPHDPPWPLLPQYNPKQSPFLPFKHNHDDVLVHISKRENLIGSVYFFLNRVVGTVQLECFLHLCGTPTPLPVSSETSSVGLHGSNMGWGLLLVQWLWARQSPFQETPSKAGTADSTDVPSDTSLDLAEETWSSGGAQGLRRRLWFSRKLSSNFLWNFTAYLQDFPVLPTQLLLVVTWDHPQHSQTHAHKYAYTCTYAHTLGLASPILNQSLTSVHLPTCSYSSS